MSIIATAVKHLLAAGVTGEALVAAIADLEAEAANAPEDRAASNKRAYDREYRQRERERKAKDRTTSYDSHDTDDAKRVLDGTPNERNLTPPLIPQKLVVVERADDCASVFAEWNVVAKRHGMRLASKLTSERRGRIKARLAEHGREAFTEAIAKAAASGFCRGANERGWKADLDFVTKPDRFLGLIEGKYDDRAAPSRNDRPGSHRPRLLADDFADSFARMG